jgi:hypothetical protein
MLKKRVLSIWERKRKNRGDIAMSLSTLSGVSGDLEEW